MEPTPTACPSAYVHGRKLSGSKPFAAIVETLGEVDVDVAEGSCCDLEARLLGLAKAQELLARDNLEAYLVAEIDPLNAYVLDSASVHL